MGVVPRWVGLVALVVALLAACGGDEPPASAPASIVATAQPSAPASIVATAQPSAPASIVATAQPSAPAPATATAQPSAPAPVAATAQPSAPVSAAATAQPSAPASATATAQPSAPAPPSVAAPGIPPPDWYRGLRLERAGPRRLPAGYALIYAAGPCGGCGFYDIGDVRRAVFDEEAGTLREERLLAFFDERDADVFDFAVSESGREMAALVCVAGYCGQGDAWPSEDAEQRLWTSDDDGGTWTNAGEVTPGSKLLRVTADDVILWFQTPDQQLVRWFASGKELSRPAAPAGFADWHSSFAGWSEDDRPVWRFGDVYLAAGGDRVPAPDERWRPARVITDAQGVPLIVADAVTDEIVLFDLAAGRAHPLSGLPVASGLVYVSDYERPGVPAYYRLLRVVAAR